MRTPQNQVSQISLPEGGFQVPGPVSCSLLSALLIGLSFLALPAAGQGISQGTPQSQMTTAARSKVPRVPNSSWPLNGSETSGSTQPRVVFEDGQLTINASDSSLSDVLYALRACTGADIDIPPGADSEHVTAQLGPGPARKVLSDLLTWSSFDYVIQGSDSDPLSIQSVTLMIHTKSTSSPPAGAPAAKPGHPEPIPARPDPERVPVAVPEAEVRTDPTAPAAANTSNAAAPDASAPTSQPLGTPTSRGLDMTPTFGSSAGKSPADMIQELQQMYQQRRVLQEQQNRGLTPSSGSPQ